MGAKIAGKHEVCESGGSAEKGKWGRERDVTEMDQGGVTSERTDAVGHALTKL